MKPSKMVQKMRNLKWHRVVFVLAGVFCSEGIDSLDSKDWAGGVLLLAVYMLLFFAAIHIEGDAQDWAGTP